MPLEDELGDVLDKAMRRARIEPPALAARAGVAVGRILDAIDYRSDLTGDELRRIASILGLNDVGLCVLGAGAYPVPQLPALPFCLWSLAMPHGIGVANAFLVGECGSARAVLFDTGAGIESLVRVWPAQVKELAAVFLTHVEPEHAGGLCAVVDRFDAPVAYVPAGAQAPCGQPVGEGATFRFGGLEVCTFATPGHAAAHNCYLVNSIGAPRGASLLVAGDLVFAGSIGAPFFCSTQLNLNLRRMLTTVPASTVIAPGHGPLTTAGHELQFNPFSV